MDATPAPKTPGATAQSAEQLQITALPGIPLISPGDDLSKIIREGLERANLSLMDGDILVLAQKIVSKAEGRYAELDSILPSAEARELAEEVDKDPRLVELILSESKGVVRKRKGVLIVEHNLGLVMANAGIDASNVEPLETDGAGEIKQQVLLLPVNPDKSCQALQNSLREKTGANVAIIVNDSVGRAWRNGTVGMAIGTSGIDALLDLNGKPDLFERPLQATQVGLADELASAASLVMGQADEGRPVVLIRGYKMQFSSGNAQDLIRAEEQDLFR